ncbi:UNVERIFIED_CONTAM: Alkane hydroxylase MAH1 [Sesamum radiatum]|uniref:Alkane hydroxylase MAH1 n=1 Tax=Sesamum radiatum TaxID=300843 RepID=A0AAW2K3R2_SESRA
MKSCEPTVWPLVGMLPAVVQYLHRGHDKVTEVLCECGGTYWFRGPWFGNIDMLFTSDPANIQHIFSKKFSNYPKGSEFRKKFEILGDGIFSADYELWELHRRTTLALMNQAKFYSSLERNVWQKIQSGLLPVLDRFTRQGTDVDLQEIFQRFTFDNICQLVLDYDPCSLSTDLPYIPCEKAFSNALEPLFHRHLLPESIWKLQKWLNLGNEEASRSLEGFRRFHLPAYFFKGGRDTTSTCLTWLFWLISTNPSAQTQILEEIKRELHVKEGENWRFFVRPDTLPSGHHIRPNTKLIISFYSMGRMETIWGKDCLEFKPERWISGRGGIEHRPSNKFPAFNVGPRTCVGKEMSFAQMKMVAATIIYHYNIKLVEGHPVTPRDSIILQAKYGLRVSLSKRDVI